MTQDDIQALFEKAGLSSYWNDFQSLLRAAIIIETKTAQNDLPLGATKFGGWPDLLEDQEWPVVLGYPLRFLGQINLTDIRQFIVARELPETGLLSFFYVDNKNTEEDFFANMDAERVQATRVIYTPNASVTVSRSNADIDHYTPSNLILTEMITAPAPERDDIKDLFGEDIERYHRMYFNYFVDDIDTHQLLGNSVDKLITERLAYTKEARAANGKPDWRLLLRIEYDRTVGWDWGKGGTLYLVTRQQDLSVHDFTRVREYNDRV